MDSPKQTTPQMSYGQKLYTFIVILFFCCNFENSASETFVTNGLIIEVINVIDIINTFIFNSWSGFICYLK